MSNDKDHMYTGNEKLILNSKELPYSMLNFWQTNLSVILLNMTRGSFAEFLVNCALDAGGFRTMDRTKTGIEPYDIEGPTIPSLGRPCRIEVKSAASVQYATKDEDEPICLPSGRLQFSIRRTIDWTNEAAGAQHNNDLYVFCHYTATRKSDNMLDMRYWDFYVYPTFMIDNNLSLSKQKTISLRRLQLLNVRKQSFDTLYAEIMRTISQISDQYADANAHPG